MANITVFDGKGDVMSWEAKVRAKLISKGYKSQLVDINRPPALIGNAPGPDLRAGWDKNANKAVGVIFMYLDPYIAA